MELKELTNNQKRKEFLEDYTGWDIWLDVPDVSERYYEYPLPDGQLSSSGRINDRDQRN